MTLVTYRVSPSSISATDFNSVYLCASTTTNIELHLQQSTPCETEVATVQGAKSFHFAVSAASSRDSNKEL